MPVIGSGQLYGSRARQVLSDLAFGKAVRVVVQDTDRYGRTVGRVHAGGRDVNAEMVREGAAWVYRQYSRDGALQRLEAEARAARPVGPARGRAHPTLEWRAAGRSAGQSTAPAATPAPPRASSAEGFSCGAKRYCREMANCAEARFYLRQCGLSRLDGDGNGVPCEALCR